MVATVPRLVTTPHGQTTIQGTAVKTDPPRGGPNVEHIVIPYILGLGDSINNVCTKYGIQTYFKDSKTLRQVLVKPKDQYPKEKRSGPIYSYQCGAVDCGEENIGEPPEPWGITTESISRSPLLYMHIAYTPVISTAQTNST